METRKPDPPWYEVAVEKKKPVPVISRVVIENVLLNERNRYGCQPNRHALRDKAYKARRRYEKKAG